MDRNEILKTPEYWTAKAQIELYTQAQKFMKETGKNQTQLAEYLGVSKGYVSQLLNGDYDHRLSKFFELALAFGVIPQIDFIPIQEYINADTYSQQFNNITSSNEDNIEWGYAEPCTSCTVVNNMITCPTDLPKKVA